jgi:hypothetical protein
MTKTAINLNKFKSLVIENKILALLEQIRLEVLLNSVKTNS